MPIMDPPQYGYEYWKQYHGDCELVHVMWTDYCGMLHEKLLPADTFGRMFRKHAYDLADADDLVPLTVSAASLTSLPDGKSAMEKTHPSYKNCNLIPDYNTIQPCIDSRRRATVFAKVEVGNGPLLDPREILKGVCKGTSPGKTQQIRASLEFQFVLRNLSDGKVKLRREGSPAQDILQKLAAALRTNTYSANGLSIRSSDIAMDGVVTISLFMSDNALDAVDNFYRVKRALKSIAGLEGLRPSFFYDSKDECGALSSDRSPEMMCKNELRCRLHLAVASGPKACDFAVGIMEAEQDACINPSIYAFAKPNWLTYPHLWFERPSAPKYEYISWGIRNSKTAINFPEGCEIGRLEFGDIDCMANMYLVVATISILGTREIDDPAILKDIPKGVLVSSANALTCPCLDHSVNNSF